MLNSIVDISVGIFVVATLTVPAIVLLAGADLTDVDPTVVTVLTVVLPVLGVLALALLFIYHIRKKGAAGG